MIVCIIVYLSFYLVGIKKGKVKPILATWIFILFATLLSIITNFKQSGVNGLFSNAYNIVDAFATLTIFLVVLFNKETRRGFTFFEKWCLSIVVFIFIVWTITGQNILAHLSIQAIMVVAYLPTVVYLWKATKNTESLGKWSFSFLASILGLIEPVKTLDLLPLVYGVRSAISTLTVVILILRLNNKNSLSKILNK